MDWSEMLYQGWASIARTLIVGTLAYVFLVVALRVSGKRTLAKLNAFDLVITVAFGSTLATILISKDVALAEGVVALILLIGLQYAVTTLSVRSARFAGLVRSEPTLLVRNGELLPQAMRRERVTEAEIRTVARTAGYDELTGIDAIVMESDGAFSVIPGGAAPQGDDGS